MGDNVWRDEHEFPLARTAYTRYYLHAAKGANSAAGDGALSTRPAEGRTARSLRVRPGEPGAHHRRPPVLRRGRAAARAVRSEPERDAGRRAGVLDAGAVARTSR